MFPLRFIETLRCLNSERFQLYVVADPTGLVINVFHRVVVVLHSAIGHSFIHFIDTRNFVFVKFNIPFHYVRRYSEFRPGLHLDYFPSTFVHRLVTPPSSSYAYISIFFNECSFQFCYISYMWPRTFAFSILFIISEVYRRSFPLCILRRKTVVTEFIFSRNLHFAESTNLLE